MSMTEFPLNDPLAVQRWSQSLAVETAKRQYFRKFMGTTEDSLIVVRKELIKKAGESITVGLRMKLAGAGIEGDNIIEGTSAEEALSFFSDKVFIDQLRKGTKSKGKMSEQRVPYNLRKQGRDALAVWWAEVYDELLMMYLAGARGVNTDFKFSTSWTGRANNTLSAPDSDHIIYGGDATGKSDLAVADTMSLSLVEKLIPLIETTDPMVQPFMIEGKKKFVLLMHPYQAYQLRTSTTTNDWMDIQMAVGERGKNNWIYQDALGEHGGMILHKHRNVIRFDDYGAAESLAAARALCLGAQAGMIAWGGDAGPGRYSWNEETDDRGNALAITAGSIFGVKKSTFNDKDFGVIAVDTYAPNPNA